MSFLKRYWIYASVGLVVLLCVVVGAFLVWRANQTVATKTVYTLPKPNPQRAEILKTVMTIPPHLGSTQPTPTKDDDPHTSYHPADLPAHAATDEAAEPSNDLLLSQDDQEEEHEPDYPRIPDGYIAAVTKPVWLKHPGYQKGDMPEIENIDRVLIKLWNQGERGFKGGMFAPEYNKVYPIYPGVQYVEWAIEPFQHDDGTIEHVPMIVSIFGPTDCTFEPRDFITGDWKHKYPNLKFVDYNDAGYEPENFLN